jgi:DNA-binding SARP family transcriptional activator
VQVEVLGPVRVREGDRVVDLGTRRQHALVAALALAGGRPVPTGTILERLWGDDPPPSAVTTLQGYVAGVRRALEPDRPARTASTVLERVHDGYALHLPVADVATLVDAVAEARRLLAVVPDHLLPQAPAGSVDTVRAALAALERATGCWRGTPYDDLADDPAAAAERARLVGLRDTALELAAVALLATGQHAEAVSRVDALLAAEPLHERAWALRAVGLVRGGHQSQALATLRRVRSTLADELGVDPGPDLRRVQTAVLRQDDALAWQAPAAVRATDRPSDGPHGPRWPLAGRRDELHRLTGLLAEAGPRVGLVAGEAGIGKTRLVEEVVARAREAGHLVATGRCSPDRPPPLWPWLGAGAELAEALGRTEPLVGDGDPDDVRTWDAVADRLDRAGAGRPVLVVVEDVQWADDSSLRLVTHLVGRIGSGVALLLTLRTGDEPGPALRETLSAAGRAGALRVDLVGLDLDAARDLLVGVRGTGGSADGATADELWRRSAGNPFFLTQLALDGGRVDGSVADVVRARLDRLPPTTGALLRTAAVLDSPVPLRLLGAAVGDDLAATEDALEPAVAAGLVVDDAGGPATYDFVHAVVREAVRMQLPAAVRRRAHAAVARAYERTTRLAEPRQRAALAHHWEQAGPAHHVDAWRSVLAAADAARAGSAYAEEARHLRRALAWTADDPGVGDTERFEVLMLIADACRWGGDWAGVSDAVDEAVTVAERDGDVVLAARAAVSTMEGALWQVRPYGVVHRPLVEALERVLHRLPADEEPLRCKAMLALAMELYYTGDTERIDRLVADALELARASGDARTVAVALVGAFTARSRPDAAQDRVAYAREATAAARAAGEVRLEVLATTLALSVASELGDSAALRVDLVPTAAAAQARGLGTAEALLRVLEVPWRTLWGEDEAAGVALGRLAVLAEELRVPNVVDAVGASAVCAAVLRDDTVELARLVEGFVGRTSIPSAPVAVLVLLRLGLVDVARQVQAANPVPLDGTDYMGPVYSSVSCAVADGLDDRELASRAYPLALRWAGRMCSAGTACPIGPVDLYLALGARVLGDLPAARRHARAAVGLARAWQLPRLVAHVERHLSDLLG